MRNKPSILRFGEISFAEQVIHLLRHWRVILTVALAAAMTVFSAAGISLPEQYSDSITLSVRNTAQNEKWSDQLTASSNAVYSLCRSISEGQLSTDYASDALGEKLDISVAAEQVKTTDGVTNTSVNLLTVTATGQSPDEVYLYLSALAENAPQLPARTQQTNIAIEAVTAPTFPASADGYANRLLLSVLAAMVGGFLCAVAVVAIRLFECAPATRKAADRLLVLPTAGALHKGGKGRGLDRCLPLPTAERAGGLYCKKLGETAAFLQNQPAKMLQVLPIVTKKGKKADERAQKATERLALNLSLAMADAGMKVCLVDRSGSALASLGIEKGRQTTRPILMNGNLTVLTDAPEEAQSEAFDKIVSAKPFGKGCGEVHTVWTFAAGQLSADEINAQTAPRGGTTDSASLLLYAAHTMRDVNALDETAVQAEEDDEVDLLKWLIATLGAMKRIRKPWLTSLALATAVALALGGLLHQSSYRSDTVFSVATADVTAAISADALEAMTRDEANELMASGTDRLFNGNALYPTAGRIDVDLLTKTMPVVWNAQLTADAIATHLGRGNLSAELTVRANKVGSFTLSVKGSDREALAEITEAFFAVAPNISAHTAVGLTFFADPSVTVADGTSVLFVLIAAWLLVLMSGAVCALIMGYNDRMVLLDYEAEEAIGVKVIGSAGYTYRTDKEQSIAQADADVALASFVYDWAEHQKRGVLMITSALREEGSAELANTVASLLWQNGKTVETVNLTDRRPAGNLQALQGDCDFLLLNAPGMAVECKGTLPTVCADGILWAVRKGYADRDCLTNAVGRLSESEKLLGCVLMQKN